MKSRLQMTNEDLIEVCRRNAYVMFRALPDGSAAAVRRNLFGASILLGIDEFGCDEVFDYGQVEEAIAALCLWRTCEEAEPSGWIRHMPSGRRRPPCPGGDATKETVRE